jgi:hypothetical protein
LPIRDLPPRTSPPFGAMSKNHYSKLHAAASYSPPRPRISQLVYFVNNFCIQCLHLISRRSKIRAICCPRPRRLASLRLVGHDLDAKTQRSAEIRRGIRICGPKNHQSLIVNHICLPAPLREAPARFRIRDPRPEITPPARRFASLCVLCVSAFSRA